MRTQQAHQSTREARIHKHDVWADRGGNAEAGALALDDEYDRAFTTQEGCQWFSCGALDGADYHQRNCAVPCFRHAVSVLPNGPSRPPPWGSFAHHPHGWDAGGSQDRCVGRRRDLAVVYTLCGRFSRPAAAHGAVGGVVVNQGATSLCAASFGEDVDREHIHEGPKQTRNLQLPRSQRVAGLIGRNE